MGRALPATNAPAPVVYALEAGVALASTALVAPVIAIVDKAIFSNASGKEALGACIKHSVTAVLGRPLAFARAPAFWWIWLVYGGTYTVANWTTVACERAAVPADLPKFVATSTTNVSLSVAKDRAFSRMYGVVAPKAVPLPSLGLFAGRDSLSILASFILPAAIADWLVTRHAVARHRADLLAQLTVPLAAQVVSTPMHLLGMDLYNRSGVGAAGRAAFIAREYVKTTAARMARILPAFGAGGVLNTRLRELAHSMRVREYGYMV